MYLTTLSACHFFEAEAGAFVRVVLVVGLILVVFDLDEVGVGSCGVGGKGDERVDRCGFGDQFEGPGLGWKVQD